MAENRYIKGKDGKLKGSLPGTPNLPKSLDTPLPPIPNNPVQDKKNDAPSISDRFEEMNRLEAESNKTLSEGFAEIGKAFAEIEKILLERQARTTEELEKAHKKSEEAKIAAIEAKAKYDAILAEKEARKPINRIRKFFNIG